MAVIERKVYNILVLGETGAGKSTFINGFYNYTAFKSFDEVCAASSVKYCIPTIFSWFDVEGQEYHIAVGRNEDESEHQQIGQSATQDVKSYLFDFGNIAIRIIDTPGFGDTEGREKDEQICEKLFRFLSAHNELHELHGIILVYHPQTNRKTTFFKYCLDHILSKLHRDAGQNIIFVFTHSKGTSFKPGPTTTLIKDVLKKMPERKVKCAKENIFCVENDCIKYFLTFFYNTDNIMFDEAEVENYRLPWEKSSAEYRRLIKYIKRLQPHSVSDTLLINSMRFYAVKLRTHLPTILETVDKNIRQCKIYADDIDKCSDDIQTLQKLVYKITYVKQERGRHLVCTNRECSKKETHGKNKEACCVNCTAPYICFCQNISMWQSQCKICGCCDVDHIFENNNDYTGKEVEKNVNIEKNVHEKQKFKNRQRLILFLLQIETKKYQAERRYIEEEVNKLLRYLEELSILSEEARFGDRNSITNEEPISADHLKRIIYSLSGLEMSGKDIQALFNQENIALKPERVMLAKNVPCGWEDALEQHS